MSGEGWDAVPSPVAAQATEPTVVPKEDARPGEGHTGPEKFEGGTHDVDAERAVLGAMLTGLGEIEEANSIITGRDFYRPGHEAIFDAINGLHDSGKPVTPILVNDSLARTKQAGMVGDQSYAFQLWEQGREGTAGFHASIIADLAARRRLHAIGLRVQQNAGEPGVDVAHAVEEAINGLSMAEMVGAQRPLRFSETVDDTLQMLMEPVTFMDTPWESLDNLIGGLRPGALYILAARPGVGKTLMAMNIATHMAKNGPVVFYSLEMTTADLQMRTISADLRIPMQRLDRRELTDVDWGKIRDRREAWKDVPLYINDFTTGTMHDIRKYAKSVHQGTALKCIVVDYLQLMSEPAGFTGGRQEFVSQVSRQLKKLAKELMVPIVALSQLNRGPASRQDKKPLITDLRESGSLEQDADVVILLYQDPENPDTTALTVDVAKNRHGITSTFELTRWYHYSTLKEVGQNP